MYSSKLQIWEKTLVPLESKIKDAVISLEQSGAQIIIVVTDKNKLAGILTDGDIRRSYLKGYTLQCNIKKIINRDPIVVDSSSTKEEVFSLMEANAINHIPIVNSKGCVVGLHSLNNIIFEKKEYDNTFVIMAGGKGLRLRPFTENCPKPMIEIAGKPILEHIILKAKKDGFKNFVITTHYLGHLIKNYFGDGQKLNVNIKYLHENIPLGTAGCLSLMENKTKSPILITNGDVLTDVSYRHMLKFHIDQNAFATMAVRHHEIKCQFGIVKTEGIELKSFEEKPIYRSQINAGIYVTNPNIINYLNKNSYCDMPSLFEKAINDDEKVIVYPTHEAWIDIGQPEQLKIAKQRL